jgi:hypothetical protein
VQKEGLFLSFHKRLRKLKMEHSTPVLVISLEHVTNEQCSSVRVTVDGLMHAADLVHVITGKKGKKAGRALRDLQESVFSSSKFIERPTVGGGHPTKLVRLNDAIELVMALPGKKAIQIRKQFKDVILRYLDGDRSMCGEIVANQAMGKIKSYNEFTSRLISINTNDTTTENNGIPQTKYVYATKSKAFPGLVKIGKTQNVKQRLYQLNTACAPAPHVIVAVAPSFDERRDENAAHAFFSDKRREGEFFEVDETEVLVFFATHITTRYSFELTQMNQVLVHQKQSFSSIGPERRWNEEGGGSK